MPVTRPAPGASPSYSSQAASGATSRKGEPGSSSRVDPLADRQLALRAVALVRLRPAALARRGQPRAQVVDERASCAPWLARNSSLSGADVRLEDVHHQPQQSVL